MSSGWWTNNPWVLIPIGAGFLSFAGLEFRDVRRLLRLGVETLGTVKGIREEPAGDDETMYHPVVHFLDSSGEERTVDGPVKWNVKRNKVGERVTVICIPGEPDSARILDTLNLWLGFLGLAGMGAMFSFFGLSVLLK